MYSAFNVIEESKRSKKSFKRNIIHLNSYPFGLVPIPLFLFIFITYTITLLQFRQFIEIVMILALILVEK